MPREQQVLAGLLMAQSILGLIKGVIRPGTIDLKVGTCLAFGFES
ncbi:hypothetical protein PSFL_24270 [Pseudomonas sp. DD1]|nr:MULTISPECIES: hypothetical protein [Pseudomonas]